MFKSRSFWSGIGFGLIIGTLLLQIMNSGSAETVPAATKQHMNEEQLQAYAEEYGYILQRSDESWYTEEQLESAVEEAIERTREELAVEPEYIVRRSFLIHPGATSEQVTDMLLQLTLIQDRSQFLSMLTDGNLHRRIRAGIYTFDGDPEPESIVEQITN